MAKGQETRERIIAQAASLFNQRGFEGGSMSDLMEATGLEKGGITAISLRRRSSRLKRSTMHGNPLSRRECKIWSGSPTALTSSSTSSRTSLSGAPSFPEDVLF